MQLEIAPAQPDLAGGYFRSDHFSFGKAGVLAFSARDSQHTSSPATTTGIHTACTSVQQLRVAAETCLQVFMQRGKLSDIEEAIG